MGDLDLSSQKNRDKISENREFTKRGNFNMNATGGNFSKLTQE